MTIKHLFALVTFIVCLNVALFSQPKNLEKDSTAMSANANVSNPFSLRTHQDNGSLIWGIFPFRKQPVDIIGLRMNRGMFKGNSFRFDFDKSRQEVKPGLKMKHLDGRYSQNLFY